MKMTRQTYESHVESNAGYCTHCNAITSEEVEPDAEEVDCLECGNETVMGIENALIYENIQITDDEDEDDDVTQVISFSDED